MKFAEKQIRTPKTNKKEPNSLMNKLNLKKRRPTWFYFIIGRQGELKRMQTIYENGH